MLPKSLELCPLPLAFVDELFSGASGDHTGTLWNSPCQPRRKVSPCSQAREVETGGDRQSGGVDNSEIWADSRPP